MPFDMPSPADLISPEAERAVRDIGIPPCPALLADLMAELRRDEPDFLITTHMISKDPGIAAALLRIVNSPFYGLRSRATTVRHAITMLGLRTAANVVAGLLVRKAFPAAAAADLTEFWESSAKVAMVTAYLARELGAADIDEAHTYALFRDCGGAVLHMRHPDYAARIAQAAPDGLGAVTACEAERYGIDHASIGAALARDWHLTDTIWAPIARHHVWAGEHGPRLPQPSLRLIAVTLLAERMWRAHRGGGTAPAEAEERFLAEHLGADDQRLEPLREDIVRILAVS